MLEGEYKGVTYKQEKNGFKIKWPSGINGFVACPGLEELQKIIDTFALEMANIEQFIYKKIPYEKKN